MLFLLKDKEVEPDAEDRYFKLIEKRATRVPLQYITGVQEFMGFKFKVSPDVLIPRQDTEVLVTEAAKTIRLWQEQQLQQLQKGSILKKFKGVPLFDVLDLCCGSGAIGLSLNGICEGITVTATDISEEALKLAVENSRNLRIGADFVQGDMFDALVNGYQYAESGPKNKKKGAKVKRFDMIVSNPPYIKTSTIPMLQEEVKSHEPMLALDGGRDGLEFYRRIVAQASDWLKSGGYLMMEIGYDQGEDLRKLIRDNGNYTPAEIIKDLPGKDRVVKCQKR